METGYTTPVVEQGAAEIWFKHEDSVTKLFSLKWNNANHTESSQLDEIF